MHVFNQNELREATELGDDFLVGAVPIRLPNGGYRMVSRQNASKYALLSPAAKRAYQKRYAPTCASVSGVPGIGARPSSYYRFVKTPGGTTLRMARHLADQWRALSPAQQRSLLWRATRNAGTRRLRTLPCL